MADASTPRAQALDEEAASAAAAAAAAERVSASVDTAEPAANGVAGANGKAGEPTPAPEPVVVDARTAYIAQLRAEAAVYPQIPDVEVRYDFSYTLKLPASSVNHVIPTVATKFRDLALAPLSLARLLLRAARGEPTSTLVTVPLLSGCRGVLRPGSMTLLISPPGHGKTTLLKALAGRLPGKLDGSVTYSGKTGAQLRAEGVQLKLLANYVDQLDVHLPYLTVRETASFACTNSTVEPSTFGDPMLAAEAANRVERVLQLLKLGGCANTLVGNNLVRGVSGGEKKRVTVAEALVSNARLFCMDEISTGLDASVTYDICASIRAWTQEMRGTVVIALLQATPEVYGLFDDVLLLREGSVVYHGPREALPGYLRGLGFSPPAAAGAASGGGLAAVDTADWLTELLASPTKLLRRAREAERLAAAPSAGATPGASSANLSTLAGGGGGGDDDFGAAPRTTAQLVAAWTGSDVCAARAKSGEPPVLALESAFARRQYGSPYPRSPATHFRSLLRRQYLITARNGLFVTFRIISSIVVSIILGTVYWQLSISQGLGKFGMLLFAVLQVAFSNLSETPFAVEYKFVAYKHVKAGMYPPWAYTLSATLMQVPTAAIETAAFSLILYFMVGLVNDGGRWAFFYFTLYLVNIGLGSMFRFIAYVVPNYEAAQTAPGPFIAIQVIFAGFLVSPKNMGTPVNGTPWLLFLYYCSVFAYALRSLAQNEFYAPKYALYLGNATGAGDAGLLAATSGTPISSQAPHGATTTYFSAAQCASLAGLDCGGETYGESVIRSLNINTAVEWKWGGIGFLGFFLILTNVVSGYALQAVHIERNVGTSRTRDEEEPGAAPGAEGGDGAPASDPAGSAAPSPRGVPLSSTRTVVLVPSIASVLPFERMTVAWRDLKYTVTLNKNLGGGSKCLLQGVSGIAVPGRLTALMGASGAGKSTLLDVIAGRKTAGAMEGAIFLNGFPREPRSFARLTAYCEQADIHHSFATVGEALAFSAALRLPAAVDGATRRAYVAEVTELLELRGIASRLIGDVGAANGLSPGQRKILTIAVELVSNAPILFLDEPTSGLDARSASVVVREVRKITDTGRTVITTVHQPSAEIFFRFDDVLLMQRGGYVAYFGPIGRRGCDLVAYLEAVPGVRPCPRAMNPASWMLDVLAGADSSSEHRHAEEEAEAEEEAAAAARLAGKAGGGGGLPEGEPAAAPGGGGGGARGSSAAAAGGGGGAPLVGADLHARLMGSPEWAAQQAAIDAASAPAPGTAPFRFASVYAHPFPRQLQVVWARALVAYNRNVGYTYTKITVLWGLMIIFGTIYYKVQQTFDCAPAQADDAVYECKNTPATLQSVVACIFLSALFVGVICMNTMLPVLMRERAVFYRERFSYMYQPEAHSLSYALTELPWLVLLVFLVVTCFYFMAGFNPAPDYYFFYMLVCIMLSYLFISLGLYASAHFPTVEVAQAVVGAVIPIAFLFGGLYLPKPQIPEGNDSTPKHPGVYWLWAYYLDPMSYALEALVPSQFADRSTPSTVGHTIQVPNQAPSDALGYVENLYGAKFTDRWAAVGYLAVFIAGLQAMHLYEVRFRMHIDR